MYVILNNVKNDLISLKSNYFSFRQKFRIHFEEANANQYKLRITIIILLQIYSNIISSWDGQTVRLN